VRVVLVGGVAAIVAYDDWRQVYPLRNNIDFLYCTGRVGARRAGDGDSKCGNAATYFIRMSFSVSIVERPLFFAGFY
jgi:hypothetical protein